ncbi:hypothetical protein L1987_86511 [Smallanthus sonchifolius]|uniref:Uncharacterized protein n=1 Tax=Smallanthus sonchifolius TaxID=185202 RepID=A0ACB8Y0K8_9ASTR|nr:hypothetical protein L1987_86511 [Smallanthus sonchifolius]
MKPNRVARVFALVSTTDVFVLWCGVEGGSGERCERKEPSLKLTQTGFKKPPTYTVEIQNACPVIDVHVKCGNFSQGLISLPTAAPPLAPPPPTPHQPYPPAPTPPHPVHPPHPSTATTPPTHLPHITPHGVRWGMWRWGGGGGGGGDWAVAAWCGGVGVGGDGGSGGGGGGDRAMAAWWGVAGGGGWRRWWWRSGGGGDG